ncbi:MAG: hypothetical protein ACLFPQ_05180 [Candidatus Woesearchaeota archaeon]
METTNKNKFFNFQMHDYSKLYLTIEMILLSGLSFILPIFIGHPQFLIGAIINFLLFRASLTMDFKRALPVILLPSMGIFTAGVLFGSLTNYVIFFIPFIWIGNGVYVLSSKYINHRYKKTFGLNVVISSLIKSAVLFAGALVMVNIFSFPAIFLTTMGLFQLHTALAGGFSAFALTKLEIALRK